MLYRILLENNCIPDSFSHLVIGVGYPLTEQENVTLVPSFTSLSIGSVTHCTGAEI